MKRWVVFLLALALVGSACSRKSATSVNRSNAITHAYIADFDYLNPILIQEGTSQEISNLIFPRLFKERFDSARGVAAYEPLLVKSFEISADHKRARFLLRDDVKWFDGKPVTARDWLFSYKLYADTVIASPRQNFIAENFALGANGQVDFEKAVQIPNDYELVVNFEKPLPTEMMLKYVNLGFVSREVWKDVERMSPAEKVAIRKDERNFNPEKIIGAGPYKVEKWIRNQECVLVANEACNLPSPPKIKYVVNRFVPEYATRLTLLKTGDADVVQNLSPDDAIQLARDPASPVNIFERGYISYDYVAWMNIDQKLYNETKRIKPHPLFGSKKVRKALTMAINRQAMIDGFLKGYGMLAVADYPPICLWAKPDLSPIPYDPEQAKKLLEEEGWKVGKDGVREKDGRKFSFTLTLNAGNQRRNYAANIIQENLRSVGIDCKIEQLESNIVMERTRKRELDAFLFGWIVSPPDIDPSETRLSDLEKTPYNMVGFQNPKVDELIKKGKGEIDLMNAAKHWKEYASIIYDEQPETILYWMTGLVGVSKRIKNARISPVGAFENLVDWELETETKAKP
ncbi:MAG: ABC transporter substrate-binding protein [Chloroherpetonaceae bacterium]|nr:ABC transporter substrate-binding protein [Chloroherpetonaceae bacterium]MDW8436614.1 ABC transporter substrate-binding protein [Chloroherpetonaceae bacterium]